MIFKKKSGSKRLGNAETLDNVTVALGDINVAFEDVTVALEESNVYVDVALGNVATKSLNDAIGALNYYSCFQVGYSWCSTASDILKNAVAAFLADDTGTVLASYCGF